MLCQSLSVLNALSLSYFTMNFLNVPASISSVLPIRLVVYDRASARSISSAHHLSGDLPYIQFIFLELGGG